MSLSMSSPVECPKCGNTDTVPTGTKYLSDPPYTQYRCESCVILFGVRDEVAPKTSLKETRNLDACCANCPYGFNHNEAHVVIDDVIICRKTAEIARNNVQHLQDYVCGDHPEFWNIEEVEDEVSDGVV